MVVAQPTRNRSGTPATSPKGCYRPPRVAPLSNISRPSTTKTNTDKAVPEQATSRCRPVRRPAPTGAVAHLQPGRLVVDPEEPPVLAHEQQGAANLLVDNWADAAFPVPESPSPGEVLGTPVLVGGRT